MNIFVCDTEVFMYDWFFIGRFYNLETDKVSEPVIIHNDCESVKALILWVQYERL